MSHLLLARGNLDYFLIALPVAFSFVVLFNAHRLGKLKGRTLLCIAAAILAAVIAFFSLRTAAVKADKAALCDWLGELSVITTDANDWYAGEVLTVTPEETEAFLDALRGLSPESLSEGSGIVGTGDIAVFFRTVDGEELLLKQSRNAVHFSFDEETSTRFGDRHFQTDDGALLDAFFDLVD